MVSRVLMFPDVRSTSRILPIQPEGTLSLRFFVHERQRAYRAEHNAQRLSVSVGAQIALEIPILRLAVQDRIVRATIGAHATSVASFVVDDRDPAIVHTDRLARAGEHTLRCVAVPAHEDTELVPLHILDDRHPSQIRTADPLMVERAGEHAGLTITAQLILHMDPF